MGKYFITGRQGSGKTTVIRRLAERGYTAYNTDDLPESTKLQHRLTGETIDWPEGLVDWKTYAWNWQPDCLKRLLDSDIDVFIGAVVSNQTEFYGMFDKVFVLMVDEPTIRMHLAGHEHDSHRLPSEIDRLASLHIEKQEQFIKEGAIPVRGGRPVDEIIGEILQHCGITPRYNDITKVIGG